MKRDVSSIFGKFAGREVPMKEERRPELLASLEERFYTVVSPVNPADPVLQEMRDEAKRNGLSLRLFWPGRGGTDDVRNDRVNASIEKGADGKWRVGPRFDIG